MQLRNADFHLLVLTELILHLRWAPAKEEISRRRRKTTTWLMFPMISLSWGKMNWKQACTFQKEREKRTRVWTGDTTRWRWDNKMLPVYRRGEHKHRATGAEGVAGAEGTLDWKKQQKRHFYNFLQRFSIHIPAHPVIWCSHFFSIYTIASPTHTQPTSTNTIVTELR